MWNVVAEEDIRCTECFHEIKFGTVCLSQMPETMPEHFHRRKYHNFCIGCVECTLKEKPPCYVRALARRYSNEEKAKEEIGCPYCGETIPKGTRTTVQKFYAWPDTTSDSKNIPSLGSDADTVARSVGVAAGGTAKRANTGAWNNLSPKTQRMFQTSGLGRGLGNRSLKGSQLFYETSVPPAIRIQGEDAVRNFVNGKHASHKLPVSKFPHLAKASRNVVWEDAKKNLSRGSKTMTGAEVTAAEKVGQVAGLKATARGAAKGGLAAAIFEAPVTGLENLFHWKRGRKSIGHAAKDAALSTAGAGVVGVGATAGAAAIAQGATLVGISPTLGPAGVPLAVAGGLLLVGTSTQSCLESKG